MKFTLSLAVAASMAATLNAVNLECKHPGPFKAKSETISLSMSVTELLLSHIFELCLIRPSLFSNWLLIRSRHPEVYHR